ncbi:hypothetical protein [Amycolatopsis sp. cmx-4-61]|uniref:hypothetical protein n=1 Tax=Amycolatopsis sp. cmx-4-61 TaxID=2790937 RepID=UPI00397A4968
MANRLRSLRPPRAEAVPESPSKAMRLLGSVVAPTTVLTGLLFFFGRQHANWLLDYFGVPLSTMGLTAEDYLVRSADGLFAPIAVVVAGVLVLLWLYRFLRARLAETAWQRLLRVATPVAVVGGVAGVAVAAVGVVHPEAFATSYAVPGAGLSLGVLFLVAASRMLASRAGRPWPAALATAEWLAAFVLVSVGLFWAVADYSASVGVGRALEIEGTLAGPPETVVYSAKSLNLTAPGVRETPCRHPDSAYHYRYTGLKLILQSGGQYFLLPVQWHKADGTAVVLPRTDALRLEFTPAADPDAPC